MLVQAPGLSRPQIYPAEELSIMGSHDFIEQVSQQGEPRRKRRRVYTGRKMSMPELSERICRGAGITVAEICRKGKGTQRESDIRERLIHVATRVMFHTTAEVARFLGLTTSAITHANHRFDRRWRDNSQLADEVIGLLNGVA
jgi:hypothetical protein